MTLAEARAILQSLLPPGIDSWTDFSEDSDPDLLLKGLAAELVEDGVDLTETLAAEVNPQTASSAGGLAAWLEGMALPPQVTEELERARVLSRWRERGTPTRTNVKASVAAITGYEPTVIEHSRATLTAENLRNWGLVGAPIAAGVNLWTLVIRDNAPASSFGARVDLTITHASPSDLVATLTSPTGEVLSIPSTLFTGTARRLFWVAFAGEVVSGTWTLRIDNNGINPGTVDDFAVLVEGYGRAASGAEGYAALIWEWSVEIDEALVSTASYDRQAVIDLVARWNPAHERGGVALVQTDGNLTALGDDDNCIGDLCVGD